MARIDERPTRGNIRDWQRKSEKVPEAISKAIRKAITGDETDDFYLGLLQGLGVASHAHVRGAGDTIIQVTAIVADLCDRKEIT